jgi:hypothetical protein
MIAPGTVELDETARLTAGPKERSQRREVGFDRTHVSSQGPLCHATAHSSPTSTGDGVSSVCCCGTRADSHPGGSVGSSRS